MKFTVYHTRYGYYGIDNNVPVYKENDLSEAALFSTESSKELLVDIYDPQVIITTMTTGQIEALPFELFDTDEMLKNQHMENKKQAQNAKIMTANTFHQLEDVIDNLNKLDDQDVILQLEGLTETENISEICEKIELS